MNGVVDWTDLQMLLMMYLPCVVSCNVTKQSLTGLL